MHGLRPESSPPCKILSALRDQPPPGANRRVDFGALQHRPVVIAPTMNLPNKLTVSRFILTIAFVGTIFAGFRFHETAAMVLFVVAGITDYYDGKIARRDKLITNFGILMDPLVDKILVCSAFIAFVGRHWLPAWMAVIIVARELAVTGMRLLAASKNMVLAAENMGKFKTSAQMVAIVSTLILHSYE